MPSSPDDVVRLLLRDVEATIGTSHRDLIESVARDVQELDIENQGETFVEDVV